MFFNRQEVRRPTSGTARWPGPVGGWVQSGNRIGAPLEQAELLDNFFPTVEGARLRRGSAVFADLGAQIESMFTYASGSTQELFAATGTAIFDCSRVNAGDNTFAEVESLTGGEWSFEQLSTSAGEYSVGFNGSDYGLFFDGADWRVLTDTATNTLGFDAETVAFVRGETVTGGTSGATAVVLGVIKTSATAGSLIFGAITGTFQDNEALTGSVAGAATADGVAASATGITLTGIDTRTIDQVFEHKERLFFVQKDSQSVFYLAPKAIGGAASELNLGSVFSEGGRILFGSTWSRDSGEGMDDYAVFVTERGEVAVYEGTDPDTATTWSLVGVFQVGEPVNKLAHFRLGGDLVFATEDGAIPMSSMFDADRAEARSTAISFPIEDAWRSDIRERSAAYPVTMTLWHSETSLVVGTPASVNNLRISYVRNIRTGAWARILGWDIRASATFGDEFYFGGTDGIVYQGDVGGTDAGTAFTGQYVPKFTEAGTSDIKATTTASLTYWAAEKAKVKFSGCSDYTIPVRSAPAPSPVTGTSTWGAGVWGTFVWGAANDRIAFESTGAAHAVGYSVAPSIQVTSGENGALAFEIIGLRLRYEVGSVF